MKIEIELDGWFPEMLQALKKNRNSTSDDSAVCSVIVKSWLLDNEKSFEKEYAEILEQEPQVTSLAGGKS